MAATSTRHMTIDECKIIRPTWIPLVLSPVKSSKSIITEKVVVVVVRSYVVASSDICFEFSREMNTGVLQVRVILTT